MQIFYSTQPLIHWTQKWLLQRESGSCNAKVIIATQVRVQDTLCYSVVDNTFAALNVTVFEELTFDYDIQLLQEPAKKKKSQTYICDFLW